jgi:hypothetical protein
LHLPKIKYYAGRFNVPVQRIIDRLERNAVHPNLQRTGSSLSVSFAAHGARKGSDGGKPVPQRLNESRIPPLVPRQSIALDEELARQKVFALIWETAARRNNPQARPDRLILSLDLAARGLTQRKIADMLGNSSSSTVIQRIRRFRAEVRRNPALAEALRDWLEPVSTQPGVRGKRVSAKFPRK